MSGEFVAVSDPCLVELKGGGSPMPQHVNMDERGPQSSMRGGEFAVPVVYYTDAPLLPSCRCGSLIRRRLQMASLAGL